MVKQPRIARLESPKHVLDVQVCRRLELGREGLHPVAASDLQVALDVLSLNGFHEDFGLLVRRCGALVPVLQVVEAQLLSLSALHCEIHAPCMQLSFAHFDTL
jgi:hypothetical protein